VWIFPEPGVENTKVLTGTNSIFKCWSMSRGYAAGAASPVKRHKRKNAHPFETGVLICNGIVAARLRAPPTLPGRTAQV
jgi:hypothetical protein